MLQHQRNFHIPAIQNVGETSWLTFQKILSKIWQFYTKNKNFSLYIETWDATDYVSVRKTVYYKLDNDTKYMVYGCLETLSPDSRFVALVRAFSSGGLVTKLRLYCLGLFVKYHKFPKTRIQKMCQESRYAADIQVK